MDNQNQTNSEYEKLKSSRFKQQKLPAWRPVPSILTTITIFSVFGVVFIIIGAIVLSFSNKIVEIVVPYSSSTTNCKSEDKYCLVDFDINSEMESPVMFYYQLTNFYQNHRRYVKSKSNDQLLGKDLTLDQVKSDCDPIITNADVGRFVSIKNTPLNKNDVANPCGLIAKSFFNDTFILKSNNSTANKIEINETGIAWEADLQLKYQKPEDEKVYEKMWINNTDEHFVVWMRPAGLPDFRKLWGRINKNLPAGKYQLNITNNYPYTIFKGTKSVVLSTVNAFGGKNTFLGVSYIVVGGICILMAIGFFIGDKIQKNKTN